MKKYLNLVFISLFIALASVGYGMPSDDVVLKRNPVIRATGDLAPLIFKAEQFLLVDLDSSSFYAKKALRIAQRDKNSVGTAIAYIYLAHIDIRKGDYRSGLENINLAQIINDFLKNDLVDASLHYAKGRLFLSAGNALEANKEGLLALTKFESLKDTLNLSRAHNFLGGVFSTTGNSEKALEGIQLALQMQKKLGLKYYNASSYSNLGLCMLRLGEPDSALIYIRKAVDLNIQSKNLIWLANNYHLKGDIYSHMGLKDSVEHYFKLALETHRKYGSQQGESNLLSDLAKLDYDKGNLELAHEKLILAFQIAEKNDLLGPQSSALSGLYRLARDNGEYQKALEYHEAYHQKKDSLKRMQNVSLLSMMELEKELAQNRMQQEVDAEQTELNQRKKNFLIIILVVVVVALGIGINLILSWNRLRRERLSVEKDELNREIEHKNKELTLSVMTQVKQNETIQNLVKTLEKGVKDIDLQEKRKVNMLIKELKQQKDDTVWEEFELRFKNVYNDFYSKLRNDFPELTLPEIKICAFLRMGLNTKEIASLLYKSQSSIEVDRARIRKKMGLTNKNVNLNSFLADM